MSWSRLAVFLHNMNLWKSAVNWNRIGAIAHKIGLWCFFVGWLQLSARYIQNCNEAKIRRRIYRRDYPPDDY